MSTAILPSFDQSRKVIFLLIPIPYDLPSGDKHIFISSCNGFEVTGTASPTTTAGTEVKQSQSLYS